MIVLIFNYKGSNSSPTHLPGGAPQGTLLGVICFIVKFNGALLRPLIDRPIVSKSDATKAKYMDDISVAVKILLENVQNGSINLQNYLDELEEFTEENGMKINHIK